MCVANDKEAFLASHAINLSGRKSYVLPDFRAVYGDDLLPFSDELIDLITVLGRFYADQSPKKVVISPLRTLFTPLLPKEFFKQIKLSFGDILNLNAFKEEMFYWGYQVVDVVQGKSEISFRGDIVDIFPIDFENPVRISLFGDEIESIRFFQCETQKSFPEEKEFVVIKPALFGLDKALYEEMEKKIALIPSDSFMKSMHSLGLWALKDRANCYIKEFSCIINETALSEIDEIDSIEKNLLEPFRGLKKLPLASRFKPIETLHVDSFLNFNKHKKIRILAKDEVLLRQENLESFSPCFVKSDLIVNIASSEEVFVSLNKPLQKKRRKLPNMVLDELKSGDYVVHENYGVGIFKGLINTSVLGAMKDFVVIEYQGDDRLLLPVENLDVIDRYIGESGRLAVVDRLGKGSFQKLKAKASEKLLEVASEIVATAAKREMVVSLPISVSNESLKLFQNDAGFEYTQDQSDVIKAIVEDFKSQKMMDRLLSGDVGFGKTEVAMNAIFAVVKSGYQAIFVAPTTLLCSQHFKSLRSRLKPYGIHVAQLDRFTSSKQKDETLEGLRDGSVQVCVGTHALFDAMLKNVALIVVDEEHKFGVKQKEKLKSMRENVHILSMSATPIPRSLNMALSSIKQYSQLLTPPSEREDVRTFVKEQDEKTIKEAILREIRRGGQVFFVHNRIASIENRKKELLAMVPSLRVLVLHSHVSAIFTEKEMKNFEDGKYDVLLSTSIIESGIHIPNVNTIIVDASDYFGMADLHQLRGRVGRSKRRGYCYFLVEDKSALSEQAKKRLIALESNSYLGSGSVLAYHDLEIRGGGNLIGEAQSGHIKNIGYSLYLKMLEDAINKLLNKLPVQSKEVDIKLSVSAYISSDYIHEDRIRLELYRRLSKCANVLEVLEIEEEMIDRFGKIDAITKQFLQIITIKILATYCDVVLISNYAQNITVKYSDEKKELLSARSKDDDDILATVLTYLKTKVKK
ncbi:MAG: transcription-repair coupling factor [Sulfurospirillaceae bacterium]|nr:transcription-repair coupling factor [Sulfurospirillaceae bacterium]